MAHYAYYNVSKKARKGSVIAVEVTSNLAETFLFVYLGLSSLAIKPETVKWDFIGCVLVATLVARFFSVFIPLGLIWCCKGGEMALKWNQVWLIAIGGAVRGAIAFGLALQINSPNKEILKTTT